jgi:hypothetical protein
MITAEVKVMRSSDQSFSTKHKVFVHKIVDECGKIRAHSHLRGLELSAGKQSRKSATPDQKTNVALVLVKIINSS